MMMLRFCLSVLLATIASTTACSQTLAAPFRVAAAAQPQLSVDSAGRVWLAYGSGREVWVTHSEDSGRTFSEAQKVVSAPKLSLGMRRGPRIAAANQKVTVTLIADELVAYESGDAGRTWSARTTINEVPGSAREGLHDLAMGPDGALFVTWLDLRSGKMELWGASSLDGGKTWSANEPVYRSPDGAICECCHPSALFDRDGNLAVMWRNDLGGSRDLWMRTRARDSKEFGVARKLGDGTWPLKGCPMDGGKIVALGRGEFSAVFQRAGEIVYVPPTGPERILGQGRQPVALATTGELILLWQQGSDLLAFRGFTSAEPFKRATDARFAVVVALPHEQGALVAYEQGVTGDKLPGFVVERW